MNKQSKYKPLADYLTKSGKETLELSFSEIEAILGFQLPPSSRAHRPNWANNEREALSNGWLPAGYESYDVDMKNEIAHFRKKGSSNPLPIKNLLTPISEESIETTENDVMKDAKYGEEDKLITDCLTKFPHNTVVEEVAMKIGLIDITNSTHVSQHKSLINCRELAQCIVNISDIDLRIKNGDPEVVNEIAKSNGKVNLFSFATKYCCYHNKNLYKRDDYSIYDSVVKKMLPVYFDDISASQIKHWVDNYDYRSFNDYITGKLNELGITIPYRKRKFDHFLWYKNREKKQ